MPLQFHLMAFLKLYGFVLNARDTAISIRKGGFAFFKDPMGEIKNSVANRGRGGPGKLHIESPLDPLEDVGCGAFNYNQVRQHFRVAYDILFSEGPKTRSLLT